MKYQKIDDHIILDDDIDNPSAMVRINAQRCGFKEFKKEYWATVLDVRGLQINLKLVRGQGQFKDSGLRLKYRNLGIFQF